MLNQELLRTEIVVQEMIPWLLNYFCSVCLNFAVNMSVSVLIVCFRIGVLISY